MNKKLDLWFHRAYNKLCLKLFAHVVQSLERFIQDLGGKSIVVKNAFINTAKDQAELFIKLKFRIRVGFVWVGRQKFILGRIMSLGTKGQHRVT